MSEPTPRPFTAAAFNQYLAEHKLMASRCPACAALCLPPRAICPACHGDQLEWAEMSGKGQLAAFTSVFVAPSAMIAEGYGRENPYVTGIVALDEGVKISARIMGVDARDPASIRIGTPLTAEFLDVGAENARHTVLAFKP